jgi:hypothetical protein
MAAGVHPAGLRRGVREAVFLVDMERIHVGAQCDRPVARLRPGKRADDPVRATPRSTAMPKLSGGSCHRCRRTVSSKAVSMGVIVPPAGHFSLEISNTIDHRHGLPSDRRDRNPEISLSR